MTRMQSAHARMFRSTPLREGRPVVDARRCARDVFRSTPLREGRRRAHRACARPIVDVSIHAPARGATLAAMRACRLGSVSIHAPARGATRQMATVDAGEMVSIHAPARGATRLDETVIDGLTGFDPRPCARGDAIGELGDVDRDVSIHAPARGATVRDDRRLTRMTCFDPRPCARGDRVGSAMVTRRSRFRSTPLREGRRRSRSLRRAQWFRSTPLREGRRPESASLAMHEMGFDPRPCARGDAACFELPRAAACVSIHAPARGATGTLPHRRWPNVSIHAPARGATRSSRWRGTRLSRFDPRPCARGDRQTR